MKTSHYICLLIFAAFFAPAQDSGEPAFSPTGSTTAKYAGMDAGAPADSWKKLLIAAPAPEMPAVAAALVQNAPVAQREPATIGVVEAALEINPTAATLVVGAIARAVPEMAAVAAAAAAAKRPTEAEAICRAATAVAPTMAGSIVGVLCKVAPESYKSVALTASQQAPGKEREILRSVAAAQPALGPHLDLEIARYERGMPSVALVLSRLPMVATNAAVTGSGQMTESSGSTSFPSLKPKDDHTDNGTNGWHGGRNYSRP